MQCDWLVWMVGLKICKAYQIRSSAAPRICGCMVGLKFLTEPIILLVGLGCDYEAGHAYTFVSAIAEYKMRYRARRRLLVFRNCRKLLQFSSPKLTANTSSVSSIPYSTCLLSSAAPPSNPTVPRT